MNTVHQMQDHCFDTSALKNWNIMEPYAMKNILVKGNPNSVYLTGLILL